MVRLGLGPGWPGVLPQLGDPQDRGVPGAASRGDRVMPARGWSRSMQRWDDGQKMPDQGELAGSSLVGSQVWAGCSGDQRAAAEDAMGREEF